MSKAASSEPRTVLPFADKTSESDQEGHECLDAGRGPAAARARAPTP